MRVEPSDATQSAPRGGPKLQAQLAKYFGVPFDAIFDVVLVDPESNRGRLLGPAADR